MVTFVLVCVGGRELEERLVEAVALAEVRRDRVAVARARVRVCEDEAAHLPVDVEAAGLDRVEVDRDLPVPELAEEEVPRGAVEGLLGAHPAEKDVARRLHEPLPEYDSLAVVLVF